jgi:hydrogenase expression/formation protein HypD
MRDVFSATDSAWRGFPSIPNSKLMLKDQFADHDAEKLFEDDLSEIAEKEFSEPEGCRCGEVLRGLITSQECPLFGTTCLPSHPVGPCMVSIEGSCNIEYRYGKSLRE